MIDVDWEKHWAEWFETFGKDRPEIIGGPTSWPIESLYQAFKARLMTEVMPDIRTVPYGDGTFTTSKLVPIPPPPKAESHPEAPEASPHPPGKPGHTP